jgi:hypothetical protein
MSSSSLQVVHQGESPFDALRRVDNDGTEWWSARDLITPLGYTKWERFADAIERAIIAINNAHSGDGDVAGQHVSRLREAVTGSVPGTVRTDYRLTRYGAYMAVMNGDPRKGPIAAAQSYFAVKAREQEIAQAVAVAAPTLAIGSLAVQAEETAAILRMLGTGVEVGLLDRSWAAGKAQLRVARVMGEEPELPAELTPLYIPDYLKSKGLTAKDITSVQSWFGRRAVEMGEANDLDVPELRPTEQPNGAIRETRAWRREHLPLFEMVWDTYYAEKYARPMFLELGAA